jgi:NTP pyrophosphatase (non-canonical NTP hydrolase)
MNEIDKEVLLIALEECAEVTQAISKVFRFGFDSKHPKEIQTNKERLEEEIGDLLCMIELMAERQLIEAEAVDRAIENKLQKLKCWSKIFGSEQNVEK